MKTSSKVIDYYDLKIHYKRDHQTDLERAIQSYENNYDYLKMTPKLRDQGLLINSNDLIPFLGHLDTSTWVELDIQRLKTEIRQKLGDLLGKAIHSEFRSHYQWCLTALETFQWGRFLKEGDSHDER